MALSRTQFWTLVGGKTALNYGKQANQFYQGGTSTSTLIPPDGTNQPWQYGPSSDHSGGLVMHLWGDGHVSAMLEDTDPTVYIQLCTKAGREPAIEPNTN